MNKSYYLLPVLALSIAACGGGGNNQRAKDSLKLVELKKEVADLEAKLKEGDTSKTVKMKNVQVASVSDTTFYHYIDVQGSVDARENVQVSTRSQGGVITAIYVKEGQYVKKGQVLAQIDDQVQRAGIEELKTQLQLAEDLYRKQANLWSQKIGSEVQYLNAKNQKEALEKKLTTMKEQLALNQIVSPINGTVDAVIAKLGDIASPAVPAFRVVNTNDLKVVANIAETFAAKVKTGDQVVVSFPDINKEIHTKIGFASKTIDPISRTIKVEIPLANTAELRPNMIAHIKIIDYKAADAIVIPVNVIQYSLGKPYVMIIYKEGDKLVAGRKTVELGRTYDDKAEIISGLKVGEQIVTTGYQGLNEGDQVQL
ncbi:efflux transporter periplasmic adaptor subunit [Chitinophaga caeni]|uniref:Efflux transporter periplasmic adaptor subunit n=1 Tax=Chitinophaga caeni TaxID=2029983 RepID=A0A291QQI7_9BACT|nr:efflux RND transporter periplasmic adaptor subunit [Chitinophaga caeni]ATL46153.1 efflux transporter periplasmic adaptor subunit [Chitinophaga caeni]